MVRELQLGCRSSAYSDRLLLQLRSSAIDEALSLRKWPGKDNATRIKHRAHRVQCGAEPLPARAEGGSSVASSLPIPFDGGK